MTISRFNLRIWAATILVFPGLLLAACGGTPSAGFTAGTYTSIVTDADVSTKPEMAGNLGSWRLRFTGKDATSGSFDAMLNGENLFTGAYTLKSDQIIITDNSPACVGKGDGTFRWRSDGKQLTLVAITDQCEDRKWFFTLHPLTLQP